MTQNIYDNPDFFAGYSRLGRSVHGLDGAAEWPVLRDMLPDLRDQAVVDLGCGFGWFCRWAREQGASRVLGLDVSENMLARARAETQDQAIGYSIANLERFDLPPGSFGVAYSSLALHYIEHLDRLLATVHGALLPGGHLVFSVEHPIYTAPSNPGWVTDAVGHKTWPVDGYLLEGPYDRLVGQGRDQATSHDRNIPQCLAPARVRDFSDRGMGTGRHADRRATRIRG